jgi:ABC-type transport system involved in multi-copper enzyme maturation permease subunit
MPIWMTPIWYLTIGTALGLLVGGLIYGLLRLVAPPLAAMIEEVTLDGLLQPHFYALLVPAAVGLVGIVWAPYRPVIAQIRRPLGLDPMLIVIVAVFVLVVFLVALFIRLAFPKVAAIALTTAKEGLAQPLFWVCLALGAFLLLTFIWIPYNTFGEDIKMLKDSGLTLMMVLSLILAVATASVSIADEIEGRTALTLLSKPIGRRQFIIGKFLGILSPVLLLFIVLGLIFLGTVSYKVVYDGGESSKIDITMDNCRDEMIQIIPGLALAFMEAVVLAAISVAISTRLPMLANMMICITVYALGHLVPLLVQSSVGKLEVVRFVGQFIATVMPVLDHFNIHAGIAAGQNVPVSYLGWMLLYCVIYSVFALLGALVLFEDRDLA